MVVHQAPCKEAALKLKEKIVQLFEKEPSVGIVLKDDLLAYTTVDNVIER